MNSTKITKIINIPFSSHFLTKTVGIIRGFDRSILDDSNGTKILNITLASDANFLKSLKTEISCTSSHFYTYDDFILLIHQYFKTGERRFISEKELKECILPEAFLYLLKNSTKEFLIFLQKSLLNPNWNRDIVDMIYKYHYLYLDSLQNKSEIDLEIDLSQFDYQKSLEESCRAEFMRFLQEYLDMEQVDILSNRIQQVISGMSDDTVIQNITEGIRTSEESSSFDRIRVFSFLSIEELSYIPDFLSQLTRCDIFELIVFTRGFSSFSRNLNYKDIGSLVDSNSNKCWKIILRFLSNLQDKNAEYKFYDLEKEETHDYILSAIIEKQNNHLCRLLDANNQVRDKIDQIQLIEHKSYFSLREHLLEAITISANRYKKVAVIVDPSMEKAEFYKELSYGVIEKGDLEGGMKSGWRFDTAMIVQFFVLLIKSTDNLDNFINILLHPVFSLNPLIAQKVIQHFSYYKNFFTIDAAKTFISNEAIEEEGKGEVLRLCDELLVLGNVLNEKKTKAFLGEEKISNVHFRVFNTLLTEKKGIFENEVYKKIRLFCNSQNSVDSTVSDYMNILSLFVLFITSSQSLIDFDLINKKQLFALLPENVDILKRSEIRFHQYDCLILYDSRITALDQISNDQYYLYDFCNLISSSTVIWHSYFREQRVDQWNCILRFFLQKVRDTECIACSNSFTFREQNDVHHENMGGLRLNSGMLCLDSTLNCYSLEKIVRNPLLYYIENVLALNKKSHWIDSYNFYEKFFTEKLFWNFVKEINQKEDIRSGYDLVKRSVSNLFQSLTHKNDLTHKNEYDHLLFQLFSSRLERTFLLYLSDSARKVESDGFILRDLQGSLEYTFRNGMNISILSRIDEILVSPNNPDIIIRECRKWMKTVADDKFSFFRMNLNLLIIANNGIMLDHQIKESFKNKNFIGEYVDINLKYGHKLVKAVKTDLGSFNDNLFKFLERLYDYSNYAVLDISDKGISDHYAHFMRYKTYIRVDDMRNLKDI